MDEFILVINAGSSSLKFQLHEVNRVCELDFALGGQISGIGSEQPKFRLQDRNKKSLLDRQLAPSEAGDLASAQEVMASWLRQELDRPPLAVGHRIVHGGPDMSHSVLVSRQVLDYLDALAPLAPLHQHNNLAPVHVILEHWPDIPQVVCFDTAFHRRQDPVIQHFALPKAYYERGVRRYGFHGLSYEYIAERLREILPEVAGGRVIAAHLGSGASACAMANGVSQETTMGFTALDGLPMATRPGRLDPGVILWMLQQGMTHSEIQALLYNESGLKGLSGISGDMRTLLASNEPAAKSAIHYFTYRAAESIAGLCIATQGIDALVFTAGVGEHAPQIRAEICSHLKWLGIELDAAANENNALKISAGNSQVGVYIVPTNEEQIIARQTIQTIRGAT